MVATNGLRYPINNSILPQWQHTYNATHIQTSIIKSIRDVVSFLLQRYVDILLVTVYGNMCSTTIIIATTPTITTAHTVLQQATIYT